MFKLLVHQSNINMYQRGNPLSAQLPSPKVGHYHIIHVQSNQGGTEKAIHSFLSDGAWLLPTRICLLSCPSQHSSSISAIDLARSLYWMSTASNLKHVSFQSGVYNAKGKISSHLMRNPPATYSTGCAEDKLLRLNMLQKWFRAQEKKKEAPFLSFIKALGSAFFSIGRRA